MGICSICRAKENLLYSIDVSDKAIGDVCGDCVIGHGYRVKCKECDDTDCTSLGTAEEMNRCCYCQSKAYDGPKMGFGESCGECQRKWFEAPQESSSKVSAIIGIALMGIPFMYVILKGGK